MRKPGRMSALAVLLLPAAAAALVTSWNALGGSASAGGVGGTILPPSLALDGAGQPVLAWANANPAYEIRLKRWTGSSWGELAGSGSTGVISQDIVAAKEPAVAVDGLGHPVVAWTGHGKDLAGITIVQPDIFLRRWNGSGWTELGGSGLGSGLSKSEGFSSGQPALALDAVGNPVVAWSEDAPGLPAHEIYLRFWDGSGWGELGGSASDGGLSALGGGSVTPSLALDAAGHPVVAWTQGGPGGQRILVKRWNGTSWTDFGGSGSGDGISGGDGMAMTPSVALDTAGKPTVAWVAGSSADRVYLKQWTGLAWVERGDSATDGGIGTTSQWTQVGGPSLALDGEGLPTVAWNSAGEVLLSRWTGTSWTDLGGSSAAGGLSNSAEESIYPALALDGGGHPVVAWREYASLYLKRWDTTVPLDQTPPGRVGDLKARPIGLSSVELIWTAAGDNGKSGLATAVEVRHSLAAQVDDEEAWFQSASGRIGVDSTIPGGQLQSLVVENLEPGSEYVFALKSVDDMGSWSVVSNLVSVTAGVTAEADDADGGTSAAKLCSSAALHRAPAIPALAAAIALGLRSRRRGNR